MSTYVATRSGTLPHVNLLPPGIEEARRFKRLQGGLALTVLGAATCVGLLYVHASSQVADAQTDLDASRAQNSVLTLRAQQYAQVPAVYASVAAAQAQLRQAMGQEVRWSFYLSDLSQRIPRDVWLTKLAVTPPAAAAAGATNPLASGGIGSVTFTGRGKKHDDVAAWLDSLTKEKRFADGYFTRSEIRELGDADVVEFDSSVTLTAEALSQRFTNSGFTNSGSTNSGSTNSGFTNSGLTDSAVHEGGEPR